MAQGVQGSGPSRKKGNKRHQPMFTIWCSCMEGQAGNAAEQLATTITHAVQGTCCNSCSWCSAKSRCTS